jgi:hypothetical protein
MNASETGVQERLPLRHDIEEYNFAHFQRKHLIEDSQATIERRGIAPGELAPDWELPRVGGGTVRLSDLRGNPVVLHFGSFT